MPDACREFDGIWLDLGCRPFARHAMIFRRTSQQGENFLRLHIHKERWQLAAPFRITGKVSEHADLVIVELQEGDLYARGEGKGVHYLGETADSVYAQIEHVRAEVEKDGLTRERLLQLLPPGGARNALDCALWDLEAKRSGCRAWDLAGLAVEPITIPYTISIQDTLEATAAAAAKAPSTTLKVKLDQDAPLERLRAVRAARPDATLIVDANQGWTLALLQDLAPGLIDLDVKMVEQPLPRGADDGLDNYRSPVPLCADESCQHLGDLETVSGRYQMVNIKLDKAGGLTHGLQLAAACRAKGIGTMVGCMVATSLSMAPAFVLAQACTFADIDGPLFLKYDRADGMLYREGRAYPPVQRLWG